MEDFIKDSNKRMDKILIHFSEYKKKIIEESKKKIYKDRWKIFDKDEEYEYQEDKGMRKKIKELNWAISNTKSLIIRNKKTLIEIKRKKKW